MINSIIYCVLLLFFSCTNHSNIIDRKVNLFIDIYQERVEFEKFLNLYSESLMLEDMMAGTRVKGKEELRNFFNWNDDSLVKKENKAFIVEKYYVNDRSVVIQGYFTPFTWNGLEVEAMQFITQLDFNEEYKIIRHRDWINYPNNLLDYTNRNNSNEWIKL